METLITSLGWGIIHSIWQFALVALLLRLAFSASPKMSAGLKYRLGILALSTCLGLFLSTVGWEYQSAPIPSPPTAIGECVDSAGLPTTGNGNDAEAPKTAGIIGVATVFVARNAPLIVLFWLIGILAKSLHFTRSWYGMRQLRRVGIQNHLSLQAQADALCQRLGIHRSVQVSLSELAKQPLTFGCLKPLVLIPIGLFSQLSPQQVEALLLHELTHIRRHDYLVNLLQSLVETLFFHHPAIWWMSDIIRQAREEACDEGVLSAGQAPLPYAQALLITQRNIFNHHKNRLAMQATNENPKHFSKRIFRIMGESAPKGRRYLSIPLLFLALVASAFALSSFVSAMSGEEGAITKTVDKIQSIEPSDMAPEIVAESMDGNEVRLSDFREKIVYVDIWASWCAPCRKEIPHLRQAEKQLRDKDVVFLSVSLDKDPAKWREFVEKEQLQGVQVFQAGVWEADICKQYAVKGIPRFMVIGKDGKIINARAPRPSQGIVPMLEELL